MPLGKGIRYRMKRTKKGKKMRLAFRGQKVVETKDMETGETHMVERRPPGRRPRLFATLLLCLFAGMATAQTETPTITPTSTPTDVPTETPTSTPTVTRTPTANPVGCAYGVTVGGIMGYQRELRWTSATMTANTSRTIVYSSRTVYVTAMDVAYAGTGSTTGHLKSGPSGPLFGMYALAAGTTAQLRYGLDLPACGGPGNLSLVRNNDGDGNLYVLLQYYEGD